MIRLFDTHHIRQTYDLCGMWDFKMEGFDTEYRLPVPGCWEQHPHFLSHRGVGTYTKKIWLNDETNIKLQFEGASHTADVYFDGERIAHHYNAFTPFGAIVRKAKAGEHELMVKVDNTFSEASALHIPNDYYTYGGITRPAEAEYLSDVYIKEMRFTPFFENGVWCADIELELQNLTDIEQCVYPAIALAGKNIKLEKCNIPADGCFAAVIRESFADAEPWDTKTPKLYSLEAVLYKNEKPIDDLIDRVGFRSVEVRGNRIYLNEKPVYFKGFNRHEDYAVEGCAVSLGHMVQDLDLMKDMNANAVRTCHYPNDQRFLDLCDERGVLVWEENHARGLVIEDMLNPNFERQCEDCIREMIYAHYNHPSIVIWGILNECASETVEGRRIYSNQYNQIKELDKSRPTTSATCRHFNDICLDLPDVISFNMYSGWYEDCDVKERNDDEIKWISEAGGAGKPIIVSEVGAAAIYGYRDRSRCKWSEERQADIIKENLNVYMNDERITGVFVWQFADCRVTEEKWFSTRARCHNNKGIVDEYRRPKQAYDTVKAVYGKSK